MIFTLVSGALALPSRSSSVFYEKAALSLAEPTADFEKVHKKCCLCEGIDYGNTVADNKCTVDAVRWVPFADNTGSKRCSRACSDASPALRSASPAYVNTPCTTAVQTKPAFRNALPCASAIGVWNAKRAPIDTWTTATIAAAKAVFEEHLKNTIVGDCDFGSPKTNDELDGLKAELVAARRAGNVVDVKSLTERIEKAEYDLRYAGAKRLCASRDMGNGCSMADMFMGKHAGGVDCRGVRMGADDTDPQPYWQIWAKLGKLDDPIKRLTRGGIKDDSVRDGGVFTTLLKDNPLFETGVKPLFYAEHSAKTTGKTAGDDGTPNTPKEYGVNVCWAFAAGGMNALITKIEGLDAITTGSRIWWLKESYDADGHEYLAITRPGVATTYSTAKELFDDDDTIVVDYWCAPPSFLEPLFAPAIMGPSPLTRAALQVLSDGLQRGRRGQHCCPEDEGREEGTRRIRR